jgi:hypothetical protein
MNEEISVHKMDGKLVKSCSEPFVDLFKLRKEKDVRSQNMCECEK